MHTLYACVLWHCTDSPISPSAPVVSPRPRVPTMHYFYVNAFGHCEIIFFLCPFISSLTLSCISKRFFFFSFKFFFYLCRCDSSTGIKGPHLLAGDVTLIINGRGFYMRQSVLQCNVQCAPHWSLPHMLERITILCIPYSLFDKNKLLIRVLLYYLITRAIYLKQDFHKAYKG